MGGGDEDEENLAMHRCLKSTQQIGHHEMSQESKAKHRFPLFFALQESSVSSDTNELKPKQDNPYMERSPSVATVNMKGKKFDRIPFHQPAFFS